MIENNYRRIQADIWEAAVKNGRDPHEVQLVAVTKMVSWAEAEILYRAGQRDFAENRLQEVLKKQEQFPSDCRWHLIGTLQSNKVRQAVGKFVLIHSVDSLQLAHKLSACSHAANVTTSILLQVNTSGEFTKHGMTVEECRRSFESFQKLPNLSIEGLMTMAPLLDNERVIRACFAELRRLREDLNVAWEGRVNLRHLSMGMSNDFAWAIAEGATLVRIGSSIFKPIA